MKEELWEILRDLEMGKISSTYANDRVLRLFGVVGQSEQLVCPECKSTDCKTAIHTDYKECNKCYHYWEAN